MTLSKHGGTWGRIAQRLAFLTPGPAALGSIPSVPKNISLEKIFNVGNVNQWGCLEERGKRLENVDRTNLVLVYWLGSTTRNIKNYGGTAKPYRQSVVSTSRASLAPE